jgi:3-mercaptopyruvate sulfurtransferase SseA
MKKILILLFFSFFNLNLNAQIDPFNTIVAYNDVAFTSPSELPEFKPYVAQLSTKIDYCLIEPMDLKCLIDTKSKIYLIDTRNKEEYNYSHIINSKSVSYDNFSVEKVWMIDRNTTVILYGIDNKHNVHIYSYMKMMGFIDVRILNGDIINWLNNCYNLIDKNGNQTTEILLNDKYKIKTLKRGKAIQKHIFF